VKVKEKGLPSVIHRKKEMFWNYIENFEVNRKTEMLKTKVSLFDIPN